MLMGGVKPKLNESTVSFFKIPKIRLESIPQSKFFFTRFIICQVKIINLKAWRSTSRPLRNANCVG